MKFNASIVINQSREKVTKLFANPVHLGEYQEGFIRKEFVSGEQGQEGAVSKVYYQTGKQKIDLTETIISNKLPDSFEGFYHHKHMDNTMKCTFTEPASGQTLYEVEIEYTRINWVMPKLFAILFPAMFRKPPERWMKNFKEFAEQQ